MSDRISDGTNDRRSLSETYPMCMAAWLARRQQAQEARIRRLEQQVQGYSLRLPRAKDKRDRFTATLAKEIQDDQAADPLHSPCACIFLDTVENREREPQGWCYSPDTLRWAWVVHQTSAAAWDIVRQALPLPCEDMLQSHFAETRTVLSHALIDIGQVGVLIDRWNNSNLEAMNDRRVVFSVDAVAFRPQITIRSDGEVEGLDDIKNLESRDLFDQYLLHPEKFTAFLREHWNHT
jgi:hypothetical protein